MTSTTDRDALPADRPARVADIGTGGGAAAVAVAKRLPATRPAGASR
ncbi:hypothetical protein ABT369_52650 [Dactylosporangium sp. NPDC000244]